ncbi:MAG: type IV pilus modification PilV family protein [Candidatus Xenobia bacterium]
MTGLRAGGARRQGFSLIEVIFAASLLSLVMLMMFNLYPSSLLTIRQAEHRLEATALAQSILEQYRAGPFSTLTTILLPGGTGNLPTNPSNNFPLQYPSPVPPPVPPPAPPPGEVFPGPPPTQGLGVVIQGYVPPGGGAGGGAAWVPIVGSVYQPVPTQLQFGIVVGDDNTKFYPWAIYSVPTTSPPTTSGRLVSVKVYVQWQEKSDGTVTAMSNPPPTAMWGGDPTSGTHDALGNPAHHEVSQELWICDIKH